MTVRENRSDRRVGRRAEQKRRWDTEHQKGASACADCGAPVWLKSARCKPCAISRQQEIRVEIQRRWKAGETLREIAAVLGTNQNSVQVTISTMRSQGWDVPYRYVVRDGRRVPGVPA